VREELKSRVGKRGWFSATVKRFGIKKYKEHVSRTILLVDIRDESGAEVTDHMWQTIGKQIEQLNPCLGERVLFLASVGAYKKGYKGRREDEGLPPVETDYCFKYASMFRRVGDPEPKELPLFPLDCSENL
jgi:hypothetical protein